MDKSSAVLTGDLIGSSHAGPEAVDSAMAAISQVVERFSGQGDVRFSRHRGDGWQVYCAMPRFGFRLVLLILARLASRPDLPPSRISLALATAPRPPSSLSGASGPAFELSGRALDGLKRGERLAFNDADAGAMPFKVALFQYLEWQAARWSPEQAEAIALSFAPDPGTMRDMAEGLGVSRQALQARMRGAGFAPLRGAVEAFEGGTAHG